MLNLFYITTESSHLNLNLMSELVSNKSDERLFSKSSSSLQLPRTLAVAHAHLSPSQKPCQHRSLGVLDCINLMVELLRSWRFWLFFTQ